MKQDCGKTLDISLIEGRLDKLLDNYRQALRAAEFLPACGPVPIGEFLSEIAQPIGSKRSRMSRIRASILRTRNRHADWAGNRLAFRSLAKMFLRSHVRSKLRTIADRLDVEQLAGGYMDVNSCKQLDIVTRRLRSYDNRLATRRTWLSKLGAWAWAVIVPLLTTYLGTLVIPSAGATVASIMSYLALYLLGFALLAYLPLFIFGVLGGFRWKRLILLGQTGDVDINIASFVRWTPAPSVNTYQSENQLFEALGLPKPSEFPWDLVLSPDKLLSAALTLAFLILALAISISAKQFSWPVLIACAIPFLVVIPFICFTIRPILRTIQQRIQHGAC